VEKARSSFIERPELTKRVLEHIKSVGGLVGFSRKNKILALQTTFCSKPKLLQQPPF
jgi:hypothetical protein